MKVQILKSLSAVPSVGEVGDIIDLPDDKARALMTVAAVKPVESADPEPKRRTYRRRDLTAEG